MERLKTYVEGLDDKLNGGVPMNNIVLVTGAPGTMKTSLTYSILYNNAKNGIPGLYFGFEQGNIPQQMEELGFDNQKVEEKLSVFDIGEIRYAIDDRGPATVNQRKGKEDTLGVDFYLRELKKYKTKFYYQVLVIDSLDALESIVNLKNRRYEMFYLFKWLRELNSTIFIISEVEPTVAGGQKYNEGFLADGIIHLSVQTVNDVESQRRLRCLKMRGTKHSMNHFVLEFEDGRFHVSDAIAH